MINFYYIFEKLVKIISFQENFSTKVHSLEKVT